MSGQLSGNQTEQEYNNGISENNLPTPQHLINTIKNAVTESTEHQVLEYKHIDRETGTSVTSALLEVRQVDFLKQGLLC